MESRSYMAALRTFIERQYADALRAVLWIASLTILISAALILIPFEGRMGHGSQAFFHPEDALALKGQEVYIQEGCHYCHTQILRPMKHEVERFSDREKLGYYPLQTIMEYYFETPFASGSERIGPDLSRAATLYTESRLRSLLASSQNRSLKQKLHNYGYLFQEQEGREGMDARPLSWKLRILLQTRTPFSEAFQQSLFEAIEAEGQTAGDALIAYLLSRGKKQMQLNGQFYKKE